jgi:hypothetical protein
LSKQDEEQFTDENQQSLRMQKAATKREEPTDSAGIICLLE